MANATFRFILDSKSDGNGGRLWIEWDTFHGQFLILAEDQNGNVAIIEDDDEEWGFDDLEDALCAYSEALHEALICDLLTGAEMAEIQNRWHGYETGDLMPAAKTQAERDLLAYGRNDLGETI